MKKAEVNGTAVEEVKDIDFEPLWDFVLFEPIKENMSKGGVILPDGATLDSTLKGRVVKAGPGDYRPDGTFVPNPIKVGDILYFLSFRQPFKVVIDSKLYLGLPGKDCVAIMKRKEEVEVK